MKKKCKHPSFWFDRTMSLCSVHNEMEMQTICVTCHKNTCQIDDVIDGEIIVKGDNNE